MYIDVIGVGDEIPTYEQVIKLEPDPCLCRPIVLIGAPGVGRRTLIRKLMNSDPSLYHPVVQRRLGRGRRRQLDSGASEQLNRSTLESAQHVCA